MIGRKSLLSFISIAIIRLFDGVVYLIAVNHFLPVQFGYYQTSLSLMSIFLLISSLGFQKAHIKIMSINKNQDSKFSIYFLIKIVLIFIGILITLEVYIYQRNIGIIKDNDEQRIIFIYLFIAFGIQSFNEIFVNSFQAKMFIAKMQITHIISSIIGNLFGIISIIVYNNFKLFIFSNVVKNIVNLLIFIYYGKIFHFGKLKLKILKDYLSLGFIFLFPIIFANLSNNLGPFFFLKYYDQSYLGIYNVIISIFGMIQGLELAFEVLLIPNFTNLIIKNEIKKLKELINNFEKFMLILNTILIFTGLIFADLIIKTLLGNEYYIKGKYLFTFSLISFIFFPLKQPYMNIIIANEDKRIYLFVTTLKFIFSLFSWLFLIQYLNIIGIVIGTWLAYIPQIIIIRKYTKKKFGFGYIDKKSFTHLSIIFLFISFSFLMEEFIESTILRFFILFLVLLIYIFIIIYYKIFTKHDYKIILNVINPKGMLNYIKKEMA